MSLNEQYSDDELLLAVKGLRLLESGFTEEETSAFLRFTSEAPDVIKIVESETYDLLANKRDGIIFGEGYDEKYYRGGLRYFRHLRRYELRLLMDERIFDPYPWMRYLEYVWFMRMSQDSEMYLHGFVYSPTRKREWGRQRGIAIEGIGRNKPFENKEFEEIFKYLFGRADEFSMNPPYAWYD